MTEQYAGNPATFPVDYTLQDDSVPPTAAAMNPALEALGDRTAFLFARLFGGEVVEMVASDTVTAPEYAVAAILDGWGGGGGGGAGTFNDDADSHGSGGGGGGGARRCFALVPIVGGEDYEVVIGGGGGGGAVTFDDPDWLVGYGLVGGDTTFTRETGSVLLARFRGAGGGGKGERDNSLGPNAMSYGHPGTSVRGDSPGGSGILLVQTTEDPNHFLLLPEQYGGAGITSNNPRDDIFRGGPSPEGFLGGVAGNNNSSSSGSYRGGGAGGGGGAGPGGDGATGGNGGAPNSGGSGGAGTAGGSAAPSTGAGGGGGGAEGGGSTTAHAGGAGGVGGSGFLRIVWLMGKTAP